MFSAIMSIITGCFEYLLLGSASEGAQQTLQEVYHKVTIRRNFKEKNLAQICKKKNHMKYACC